MWLWSPRLTLTHPPLVIGSDYDTQCGWNGFVLVQNITGPLMNGVGRSGTRDVTLVDALYTDTGELVTYPHYLSVWRRIARRLRTMTTSPGPSRGHRLWDGHPWSPAALTEALDILDQRPWPT